MVDDSKEKDKGKKTLKRSITSIAGFMRVGQCEEVEGDKIVKRRKLSERLQDPITNKKDGRCTKANVNSWRNQILTLKKKFSRDKV